MHKQLLFLILATSFISSSTIHGTVYDASFNPVKDVVLQINSTPTQTFVSKNGSYEFVVSNGIYEIKTTKNNASITSEEISIEREGEYNIDLLFLSFAIDTSIEPIGDGVELTPDEENAFTTQTEYIGWILGIAFVISIAAIIYHVKKQHAPLIKVEQKELNDVQAELIRTIKKNNNVMNQRELRKQVPYSEARVSMELEILQQKGLVRKYKNGRGNIVELTK